MKKYIFKLKVCFLILFTKDCFYVNHIKNNRPIKFYEL
jgi:hypothetical protein